METAVPATREQSENYQISKPLGTVLLILAVMLLVTSLSVVLRYKTLLALSNQRTDIALGPTIGVTMSQLTGIDRSGTPVNISFGADGKKTVLFVFSTECRICRLNWPAWQKVANSVDKNSYRLIYINALTALTSEAFSKQYQATSDYLKEYQMGSSPILAQVDPAGLFRYNIRLAPETILIDGHGKIERAWLGMLDGDQLSDVERTLGI
jgi:hypothetical protein